jgi:hypothetical protein
MDILSFVTSFTGAFSGETRGETNNISSVEDVEFKTETLWGYHSPNI